MKIYQGESSGDDAPNLTPMIDVVFLLLIFFLVAARFDEQERELPANLPQVVSAEPLAMTTDLIVNITKGGKFKGNAILANKIARAVYFMLQKGTGFDAERIVSSARQILIARTDVSPKAELEDGVLFLYVEDAKRWDNEL